MVLEEEPLPGNWKLFKLKNQQGMEVHMLNYGGIITKILTPDRHGKLENVVLGYRKLSDYETDPYFLGAMIGRVAGRIKEAHFTIHETRYELEANDGRNHLHSGSHGFHQMMWDAEPFEREDNVGVKLRYLSKDGENGYPGNVEVAVTYTLTNDNELVLDYWASTDQRTPLALTNHSYFNLTGDMKGTIHDHLVKIDSQYFAELDADLIPTGRRLDVAGTPFDFNRGRKLGEGIAADNAQNELAGNGYDHYFFFHEPEQKKAVVKEEGSGRTLTMETNQPGMVMYTSNNLENGLVLSEGAAEPYSGVCFETQGSPASLHEKEFPRIVLDPEEEYQQRTLFRFGVDD
ncbi:aldose epimerase family protein [Virgibacillus xinjiangensis]|uniref:Aldose 1-epimerase n=1 Tax=Virgibacillus xinjiangensis TaxID=393090 RepID=A0ABV7CQM4_9BACI